jgi:hypothetical protein
MWRGTWALAALLGACPLVVALASQQTHPVVRGYRANLLTLAIQTGCDQYTWPNVSIASAPEKSRWRSAAVHRICETLSVNGVVLGVRTDGVVEAQHGQAQTVETFVAALYKGASYQVDETRVVVLGSGAITFSPASTEATFVSLKIEFERVRRQIQFLQSQYNLEKTAAVIDVKIASDESISFAGLADQSTDAAALRAVFVDSCRARYWDLPYERTVLCGLQAAIIRLSP